METVFLQQFLLHHHTPGFELTAAEIRERIVNEMVAMRHQPYGGVTANDRTTFEQFLAVDFDNYIADMRQPTTYGDATVIAVGARIFGFRAHVYHRPDERPIVIAPPRDTAALVTIHLRFMADGQHYQALTPIRTRTLSSVFHALSGSARKR